MPRGKAKFPTTSPRDEAWATDPEQALRNIAARNNAEYIEGSLIYSTGGQQAEALFKTIEPAADSTATRLHRLGMELDASEFALFVDRTTLDEYEEESRSS
jgi:hypothetical protein